MIIFALGYLVVLLLLALVLNLRRSYLITSPLPVLAFFLPLLQLFAAAMSIIAIVVGVSILIKEKKLGNPLEKLWLALILASLPLLMLLSVMLLDKFM